MFSVLRPATALLALGLVLATPPAIQTAPAGRSEKATFAGGCFWCMEPPFDTLEGVVSTTSGYIGGRTANPTYEQVSGGATGHTEAIQVVYDPSKITFEKLLDVFWHNADPLDAGGQFCDRGTQYRSGIFYHSENQKTAAEQSKASVASQLKKPVVTEITSAGQFYPAEGYHQDYYTKNPVRYKYYKWNCGRDQRLEKIWGKPSTK